MVKWEYWTLYDTGGLYMRLLDEQGLDGWEIISAKFNRAGKVIAVLMKRPLPNED